MGKEFKERSWELSGTSDLCCGLRERKGEREREWLTVADEYLVLSKNVISATKSQMQNLRGDAHCSDMSIIG
jgi:hypothetical protein